MGRRERWGNIFLQRSPRFAPAIVATLAITLLSLISATQAYSFCERGIVRDYAKPLERMPALRPPPKGGLPFGPRGIALGLRDQRRSQLMLPGRKRFGYAVFHSRFLGAKGPIKVNWIITAKLIRVDFRGRVIRPLRWARQHATWLTAKRQSRLPLVFPGKPGFYRIQIVFRNGAGKRIGGFGQYVRILRPNLDVRLTLNKTSYRPGDVVIPQLKNYGTLSPGTFGLGGTLERHDGSTWRPVNDIGPTPFIGLGIGPGESASCWEAKIPEDAAPGLYRFTSRVGNEVLASPEFQVLAPS